MKQILISDYYPDFYEASTQEKRQEATYFKFFTYSLIIVGIFLSLILFYLAQKTQWTNAAYEITRLEDLAKEVRMSQSMLLIEKTSLLQSSRIEKIASQQLGLIVPQERKVIILE